MKQLNVIFLFNYIWLLFFNFYNSTVGVSDFCKEDKIPSWEFVIMGRYSFKLFEPRYFINKFDILNIIYLCLIPFVSYQENISIDLISH